MRDKTGDLKESPGSLSTEDLAVTQPDPNMICMAIETWPNDGDFAPREGDVVGYEEAPAGDDPRPRWRRVIVLGDTRTDSGVEYYHVKRCCDGYEFYLRLDQMKSWGRLQAISAAMGYLTSTIVTNEMISITTVSPAPRAIPWSTNMMENRT